MYFTAYTLYGLKTVRRTEYGVFPTMKGQNNRIFDLFIICHICYRIPRCIWYIYIWLKFGLQCTPHYRDTVWGIDDVHCTSYNVRYGMYIVLHTPHHIYIEFGIGMVYVVRCTLYTMYAVQCTMYAVRRTMYAADIKSEI